METLGVWLRQAREAKGSTLEEVEAATRIRPRFLEALETGDFAVFPGGEVQVRGFLRIYARYLELSPDQVIARYDAEVHGVEAMAPPRGAAETQPALRSQPAPSPTSLRSPSFSPPTSGMRRMNLERLMIIGAALIGLLAIVTAIGYFIGRGANGRGAVESATPAVAATAPSEAVLPSVGTGMGSPASPLVTPTFPVNPQGGVTLMLEATEHVWVRVKGDDQAVFEGMMGAGQVETWSAQEVIAVETGNGAGLLVTVNGQLQGPLCGRAQVCTRAWGPAGEVTAP
jgi:transcriptional regulator with XRE-family HTH domain